MANFASAIDSLHENEVEEIIIDITQIEESAQWHPECCIYKVPKRLRDVMEQAYTPKLISIGPVHYGKLANMEKLKLKYFKDFFSRPGKSQKEFASIIEEYEDKIRHCYAAEISLPEREVFLKMILLDSIFIIELFLKNTSAQKDYILCKPWLAFGILQDLILLENQLPFFILNHLYDQSRFPDNHKTFLMLACAYFFGDDIELSPENEVKHFTDLQRYFYYPPNQDIGDGIQYLPSATKLDTAGLLFKKWKPHKLEENSLAADRRLLDIKLQKNCLPFLQKLSCLEFLQTHLVIPPFAVDDRTEEHFRNLMALEMCHYPFNAYICNYILLLDFLINSKEDVELLVKERIIVNSLGSNKAVANMVNKLGQEIIEVNSYYFGVADAVNKHYLSPWNLNMASLKKVYFRDIWRGSATVAAVLVLSMAILSFLGPSAFRII
ncbi:hypothetical protein RGQ29_017061 [Quercus rubra]|uniref:Uncharacterized protein n=1 Tax=Quercus rubra TaxID=3512 RepID=A0AAN7FM81_QUERU|nr:hypothetical protein RGQ29_017061 [Quercus rubra]KAK4592761.1 hypothetical protein RGQ29_017061 [Quercus rubra]KAK4592762.1 hypothetical protein RGQ29_017061 [Quercus rubra]